METLQGSISAEHLNQQEKIARIENQSSFLNAVSAKFSYQTAILQMANLQPELYAEMQNEENQQKIKNQEKEDKEKEIYLDSGRFDHEARQQLNANPDYPKMEEWEKKIAFIEKINELQRQEINNSQG